MGAMSGIVTERDKVKVAAKGELKMRKSERKCASPMKDGESEYTVEANAMAVV